MEENNLKESRHIQEVVLDNQKIRLTELNERMKEAQNQGKKIVEISPGVYKTLTRLQG